MTSFLIYIFKWAVALTLLYSLYGLLLRRETFHTLKRIVLVGILLIGAVLPFVHISTPHKTIIQQTSEKVEMLASSTVHDMEAEGIELVFLPDSSQEAGVTLSWVHALCIIYTIGAILCWGSYLRSIIGVVMLIKSAKPLSLSETGRDCVSLISQKVSAPCSWLRWILLNPRDLGAGLEATLTHEMAHLRLGHSWDMLLCEATCRMLWFLPFAWMLREDLSDVHEYEADRAVQQHGFPQKEYTELLIRKSSVSRKQPVVNAFNQAQIKKRLRMMYAHPSTKAAMFKVLYLLPLIGFALSVFATPRIEDRIEHAVEEAMQPLGAEEPQGISSQPDEELTDTVSNPVFTGTVEFDEEPLYTGTLVAGEDTVHLQNARYEHVNPQPSALTGRWVQTFLNSEGKLVISQQKVYLPDGTFSTICIHNNGEEHTISAGTWQPIDEHHYVEHIGYITTDPSSEGKENVITYSLAGNDQQLYLSYVMPGNGVSGSEFWQRIE